MTLDPHLTTLDSVLTGPDAPTWFVSLSDLRAPRPGGHARTDRVLHADYHRVADLHGRTVYLRNGVIRRSLRSPVPIRGRRGPLHHHLPDQEKP